MSIVKFFMKMPSFSGEEDDLDLCLNVTGFKCGGFVIGLRSSHVMFDGVGQAEFLKAVGELARGLPRPSVAPVWGRDAFRNQPKFPRGPPPALTPFNFEISVFDLTSDLVSQVKNQYLKETGQRCSSFDVVTAKVWQCRTRVVGLTSPDDRVHLGFAVNTRHLLQDVLPAEGGYYGNCVYNMAVSAAGDVVACAPLVEVVGLIREAKRRVPAEFSQWMTGGAAVANALPLGYATMTVLDWSRVGLFEVDYGWGQPMYGTPLVDTNFIAWCILLKPLPPNQGLRLFMRCVEKQHLAYFSSQMISSA
ncbi:hypothetical protein Cni_G07869 [Canna indica]|uniref:Uncharacterized protein n=1 Tax=Canna indica TaxID=4628 RepID=A0AAQ3Q7S9_9LILI|nr:hypothetical protein Cni_G07869 [Canna indica]